jgi:hypothetical protein
VKNLLLIGMVVISVLASQRPSHASAPMALTQAPGFYRVMIGNLEVTPLNDGVVPYKTRDVLPTATDQQIQHFLSDNALTDPVGMSYNGFLINTGSKLILVDTGSGGKLEDDPSFHGTGRLMANLRASGYRREAGDPSAGDAVKSYFQRQHMLASSAGDLAAPRSSTISVLEEDLRCYSARSPDEFFQSARSRSPLSWKPSVRVLGGSRRACPPSLMRSRASVPGVVPNVRLNSRVR